MAAPKKTTEPIKIKIGNITIEKGKKYTIDHKFDGSAPDGLRKIEATRLPFERNSIEDCVEFDESKELYDTGFYEESYCLSQYTQAEKEEWVKVYNKEIRQPYENKKNVSLSQQEDNAYYKKYRFELYTNKEFDTSNPLDLFDLFNAILQRHICAKDERNPYYNGDAQFNLSNPQDIKNKSKEKTKKRRQTLEKFIVMSDANRDKLNLVLEFIGRENPAKIDSEDLKDLYFDIIHNTDNGMDFVDRFLEASERYDSEIGKVEMENFAAAKRLLKANKIKKTAKGFYTVNDEHFLGTSLQDIAKFCLNTSSQQYKIITELIIELGE